MTLEKTAKECGYKTNKEVKFKKINSIFIKNFRTLKDREIILGSNITLISGKNGTMKSSILGLIAHPFSSPNNASDIFGNSLKTEMSNVFKMSLAKDIEQYQYYLNATTTSDIVFSEPIRMYPRPEEGRHRITVGKDNSAGLGNFLLNTSYINLKRLFPIIDTSADIMTTYTFTSKEKAWITRAYMDIMTRESFSDFDCISDYKQKNTLGPKNASYDFNSISSGEDNLGNILMKMLAFEKNKVPDSDLQGIFCIDEIEASLHPVALTNLIDFLLKWSENNHVQIVATTHSLYLLDYCLKKQMQHESYKEKICINIISTAQVGSSKNYRVISSPTYKEVYKELTLKNPEEDSLYKVNILCEDTVAITLLKRIIASKKVITNLEFISDVSGNTGTSCNGLIALGKNGYRLLEDSIIILDPDVSEAAITPVKNKKVDIFIIADKFNQSGTPGLSIEKDIAEFICSLDGEDDFFKNDEKTIFLNELHRYGIYENQINASDDNTKYKNWAKSDLRKFNKAINAYAKKNPAIFEKFKEDLLTAINSKLEHKGLPLINY